MILLLFAFITSLLALWYTRTVAQQRRTTCLDNLRKVGMALRQYATENDDSWPSAEAWAYQKISPATLSGCPAAAPLPSVDPPLRESGVPGYAYNSLLVGDTVTTTGKVEMRAIKTAEILRPQWTIAALDYMRGIPVIDSLKPFPPPMEFPRAFEKGWQRHAGGGHYLFCDGHAGWYKPQQIFEPHTEICKGEGEAPTFCKD